MDVRDIKPGIKVEYETQSDEIIEGVVVRIVSPTEILVRNTPGTHQRFIAHPDWLTVCE